MASKRASDTRRVRAWTRSRPQRAPRRQTLEPDHSSLLQLINKLIIRYFIKIIIYMLSGLILYTIIQKWKERKKKKQAQIPEFISCKSHDFVFIVFPSKSKRGMKRQKLQSFSLWWMLRYLPTILSLALIN